ncbi:MAG: hypothetical protein IPI01_15975 [Ignavibacteriae bacterium]|nr:hypothetical protein [Ignavibacteriota bacterium]
MNRYHIMGLLVALFAGTDASAQPGLAWEGPYAVRFEGRYGQVEAGGPLAGIEHHDSRPFPSRISFYVPVANSIDLSTDYWKRGGSRPVVAGIRVDGGARHWIGKEPWNYVQSPHSVRFDRGDGDLRFAVQYDFGGRTAAAVMRIVVRNAGTGAHDIELYTHTMLALRSCQTYTRYTPVRTRYDTAHRAVVAEYDDLQLAEANVIVQNAGLSPASWSTNGAVLAAADSGWSNWIDRNGALSGVTSVRGTANTPVAAFQYVARLAPGDSLQVILVYSCAPANAVTATLSRNARGWLDDIDAYAGDVEQSAAAIAGFRTGDAWTDSSVHYAGALLASNHHMLDGALLPMPCPAEYNFFFTHDVLLSGLSAVAYDPARVKRDLEYIGRHAKDGIIPHARYWKDDGYKTEYCQPGNWNHVWFILDAAAYLRHTDDTEEIRWMMPLLTGSLEQTLLRRKGSIMHGTEPDWWDFGKAEGGRAYLTILTIRALEEYVYLGARTRSDLSRLAGFASAAAELRTGLMRELWNEDAGTLLNTIGTDRDQHVYMGPLLAPVFGAVPGVAGRRIVETVRQRLLDPAVGVRTVDPADFHTDSVKALYSVKGNEAGEAYWYANGGIWYLGNAWYAAALHAVGEADSALAFYRRTMTLDGITRSPNGQPALYEYRFGDPASPQRGTVDKPTMMWAAGFCIGTAYRLAGIQDNIWNVTVAGSMPAGFTDISVPYAFGRQKHIVRTGKGAMLTRMTADGRQIASRILPLDAADAGQIAITMGPVLYPFLDSLNAVLHSANVDPQRRTFTCTASSYPGHVTTMRIITPWLAEGVTLNGKPWTTWRTVSTPPGTIVVEITYPGSDGMDRVEVSFGGKK